MSFPAFAKELIELSSKSIIANKYSSV